MRQIRFWWREGEHKKFGAWLENGPALRRQLIDKVGRYPAGGAGVEYK